MSKSFIKESRFLDETHEIEDLLDFSTIINQFGNRLRNIEKSSLVGLIGAFGTGKSTMLYQLSKQKTSTEKWVFFDAWKFPERSNLWEGFILDLIRSTDEKLFEKIRRKIDGESKAGIKSLISVLSQGANLFQPGLGLAENFNKLFQSSPIRRVFEFQEILAEFINKHLGNIQTLYIVVEDIDRSGDKGIFFLETLKHFLRTNQFNKKIVVIVPISNKNFSEHMESYLKPLDYFEYFEPRKINFSKFIDTIFDEEAFPSQIDSAKENLNLLLGHILETDGVTIRNLKNILRNTEIHYKSLNETDRKNVDLRIFLLFSALKRLNKKFVERDQNNYKVIKTDSSWHIPYLIIVANNTTSIKGFHPDLTISFVNQQYFIPKHGHDFDDDDKRGKYYISDLYLDLFDLR